MVIEARAEAPLLPLRLFRLKTLAGSNAVGFLLGASFYGYIFTAPCACSRCSDTPR